MHAVDCDFSLKCIKELVNSGSEINHLSKDGMTALCNSYALKNKSIFAYLIEAGANADLKRPSGSSLRKEITTDDNEDFMRLLPLTATQKKQLKKAAAKKKKVEEVAPKMEVKEDEGWERAPVGKRKKVSKRQEDS